MRSRSFQNVVLLSAALRDLAERRTTFWNVTLVSGLSQNLGSDRVPMSINT